MAIPGTADPTSLPERLRRAAIADAEAITLAHGGLVAHVGEGLVVVTGPGSFLNGMRGVIAPTESDLERLGAICDGAGVTPEVVVPGGVSGGTLETLAHAGYRLVGVDNLYVIDLPAAEALRSEEVAVVDRDDLLRQWLDVHSGQFPSRSVSDAFALAAHSVDGAVDLLADCGGTPAAVASLIVRDGRGLLGGAATLPEFRGRGLQTALLRHRLWLAHTMGCDIASCTAAAGGTSARNVERVGFRLVDVELSFERGAAQAS